MSAQLSYKTLRAENSAEFVINKSRFIGYGCPCETEDEALAFLARIRQKHKDATHNCYAYIIGLNSGIMRYSDDGEPGGTAGMPIIEVMKARGVVNCAVVVTRYFGGILLGARRQSHYAQGSKRAALDAAGVVVMERARAIWSRWIIPLGSGGIFSPLRAGHHRAYGIRRERRLYADGSRRRRGKPACGKSPASPTARRRRWKTLARCSTRGLNNSKAPASRVLSVDTAQPGALPKLCFRCRFDDLLFSYRPTDYTGMNACCPC